MKDPIIPIRASIIKNRVTSLGKACESLFILYKVKTMASMVSLSLLLFAIARQRNRSGLLLNSAHFFDLQKYI
jgi:hypothetical protein